MSECESADSSLHRARTDAFNKGSIGVRLVDDFSEERSIDGPPFRRAVAQRRHVPHVEQFARVIQGGERARRADVNAENYHCAFTSFNKQRSQRLWLGLSRRHSPSVIGGDKRDNSSLLVTVGRRA